VVHAPLSPAYRKKFNETAALELFRSLNGTDYGYYNMLMSWIDTESDNYPCRAPDYKTCLEWDHVEIVFGILDKVLPSIVDQMFGQAFNNRLGTKGLSFAATLMESERQGIPSRKLPTLPEKDSYMYETTRFGKPIVGKSMVCCVFVCNMWKAGGIFKDSIDNDFNCAEAVNTDDFSLDLFDHNYQRPQACVDADPDNQLCQISGAYSLKLNNYNSVQPYKHMHEKCASLAPDYKRAPNC
jgi:hypothetical protein